MRVIIGMFLGLILVSSVFANNVNAFADWSKWTSVPKEPTMVKDTKSKSDIKKPEVTKKDTKKKTTDTKKKSKEMKKTVKSETKKKEVQNGKTNIKIASEECNSAATTYNIKSNNVNLEVMKHFGWPEVSQSVADYVMNSFATDDISDMNKAANVLIEKCGYQSYDDIRKDLGGINHSIIDAVKQYGNTDIRNIIKKNMSLDDCSDWSNIYKKSKGTVNNDVSGRFGTDEISQRLADHVTSGGSVTDSIKAANKAATILVDSCNYTEGSLVYVLGGFNQNIIDSIKQYKNMKIQDIK